MGLGILYRHYTAPNGSTEHTSSRVLQSTLGAVYTTAEYSPGQSTLLQSTHRGSLHYCRVLTGAVYTTAEYSQGQSTLLQSTHRGGLHYCRVLEYCRVLTQRADGRTFGLDGDADGLPLPSAGPLRRFKTAAALF